ncbi:hypothetical protein Tco_0020766 [Tanacetum coccineum]
MGLAKKPSSRGIVRRLKLRNNLKRFITSSKKAMRHCIKLGKARALKSIQTIADHSQKWHDGSRRTNNSSSDEIATITSKLDSLGRDMKRLKENVHAIQVGCRTCGGTHLDKECPFNEEVKVVEEVKYVEF